METMERIKALLKEAGVEDYSVYGVNERTAELFFVKKQLDTRRIKDVEKFYVNVFRTAEAEGKRMRASTNCMVLASMTDDEIMEALRGAYFAAQFAMNPYYDLPDPVAAPIIEKKGALAERLPEECAGEMAEALFKADNVEGAFINSAEVFIIKKRIHFISSNGSDVSWTEAKAKGEYVVQAKEPEDVEMFDQFGFDELETEALTKQIAEALSFVKDRARAERVLKSGKYDLILTGKNAAEVMSFYAYRSAAAMVFPGYSTWKVGDDVQGETEGERLELSLKATAPYSTEGIPMKDRKLVENGFLKLTHGGNRFCRYLGVEPTGDYDKISCENAGTLSFGDMKKTPCLWAVTFSDFQMDTFTGHFGGEIRLAYLIEDGKATPVTGGSVNGSILEAESDLAFSTDRYTCDVYEGPYAMKLKGVSVAGE